MTNNALAPRTQIKHGFQTALSISRYHSVLLLKGNPMPAVITAPEKLAAAQALFAETLLAALPQKAACTVSGSGGGFEAEVSYSAELDLWYAMQPQGKKCWNGFGIGQPVAGKKVSIAAEINFPAEGLNRLDIAGLEMLLDERKTLQKNGGDLYIIGMKPYLRRKLQHSPYWEMLGGDTHLFESTYVACREICLSLGIRNYRGYMKYLFRDYNKL